MCVSCRFALDDPSKLDDLTDSSTAPPEGDGSGEEDGKDKSAATPDSKVKGFKHVLPTPGPSSSSRKSKLDHPMAVSQDNVLKAHCPCSMIGSWNFQFFLKWSVHMVWSIQQSGELMNARMDMG